MARLHTSGRDTTIKVPFQKEHAGARIIRLTDPTKAERARHHFKHHPLRLTVPAAAGQPSTNPTNTPTRTQEDAM